MFLFESMLEIGHDQLGRHALGIHANSGTHVADAVFHSVDRLGFSLQLKDWPHTPQVDEGRRAQTTATKVVKYTALVDSSLLRPRF